MRKLHQNFYDKTYILTNSDHSFAIDDSIMQKRRHSSDLP